MGIAIERTSKFAKVANADFFPASTLYSPSCGLDHNRNVNILHNWADY